MPMFTVAELGDNDLAAIVELVADLDPEDTASVRGSMPGESTLATTSRPTTGWG